MQLKIIITLAGWYLRYNSKRQRASLLGQLNAESSGVASLTNPHIVGFFHPYCNAGGGGERVLWAAIAFLQHTEPQVISVVYTGDIDVTKSQIISKVHARFGIQLESSTLAFVYLPSRHLVDGNTWSRFTLLGQSLGSLKLAWEAMNRLIPDIFIDTMGYAFIFTFIRSLGIKSPVSTTMKLIPTGAYVHYPTISTDMLRRVQNREEGVTNNATITTSFWRTNLKLAYYRMFAFAYSYSLSRANVMVVNGTWTGDHVQSLLARWRTPAKSHRDDDSTPSGSVDILYPPCDTEALQSLPLLKRKPVILSVAQFRPEKNHSAQLRAVHSLLQTHPDYNEKISLVLLGSVRNSEDAARVEALKQLSVDLGIQDLIQFVVNASYEELVHWLGHSSIGVSSMIDEHFGINVVEFMVQIGPHPAILSLAYGVAKAAGLIPVAHASGGPLLDIIVPMSGLPTGFLYETDPESRLFGEALFKALSLSTEEQHAMRERARIGSQRFSGAKFEEGFAKVWERLNKL